MVLEQPSLSDKATMAISQTTELGRRTRRGRVEVYICRGERTLGFYELVNEVEI